MSAIGRIHDKTDPEKIYFSFPSGLLHYDCAACGAQCCKGFGYFVDAGERLHQLTRSPLVRHFISGGAGTSVGNAPPGCFFLGEDRRCDIHVQDGISAKPETCRLFPFNAIREVGNYFVVMPHHGLCPLEVRDLATRSRCSAHDVLLSEMQLRGVRQTTQHCLAPTARLDALISLERAIVQLASSRGPCTETLDFLQQVSDLEYEQRDALGVAAATPVDVRQYTERACRLLGVHQRELDFGTTGIGPVFNVVLPTMRAQLLFQTPGASGHLALVGLGLSVVTRMTIVLAIYAAIARAAGMRAVTFQTIARILTSKGSIIWLLGLLDSEVAFKPSVRLREELHAPAPMTDSWATLLPLLVAETSRTSSTLEVAVGEVLDALRPAGIEPRLNFLEFAANRLYGKLAIPDMTHARRGAPPLRDRFHNWVVANAGAERIRTMIRPS